MDWIDDACRRIANQPAIGSELARVTLASILGRLEGTGAIEPSELSATPDGGSWAVWQVPGQEWVATLTVSADGQVVKVSQMDLVEGGAIEVVLPSFEATAWLYEHSPGMFVDS